MILWYLWYCGTLFRYLYWETSGWSLDEEGVYVTSRFGTLRNLFFEDTCSQVIWTVMMLKHLSLIMMRDDRWHDVLLLWHKQVLLTQFYWVCRVFDLEDAEASTEPLDSGLSQGGGYWDWFIYGDIALFWWYDIDFMICCWHVLTWWLMMQADDSLPTRLTYGVKGPHTIFREVEGQGWTTTLPPPTSTVVVDRTVG